MKRLLVIALLAILGTACAGDPLKGGGIIATADVAPPTTTAPYVNPYTDVTTTTTRPRIVTTTTTAYAYPNGWSDETAANFMEAFTDNYQANAGRAPDQAWVNCAGAAVMLRWSPTEADRLAAQGRAQVVIDEILEQCGNPR